MSNFTSLRIFDQEIGQICVFRRLEKSSHTKADKCSQNCLIKNSFKKLYPFDFLLDRYLGMMDFIYINKNIPFCRELKDEIFEKNIKSDSYNRSDRGERDKNTFGTREHVWRKLEEIMNAQYTSRKIHA